MSGALYPTVLIHPHEYRPTITVHGGREPFAVVAVATGVSVLEGNPETLFAYAEAFLAAAQQLEHALELQAARAVNAANAATDAQPFGTLPTPVQHITVTAPDISGTDINQPAAQVAS